MKYFLIVLWVCAAVWAQANPMAGRWRASNGMTLEIPAGAGPFQLVCKLADGKTVSHPARWVKPGEQFTWTDKQGAGHTATLDVNYKVPRIKDVGEAFPDSPAFWYRADPK